LFHGHTYSAHPLACAAALATLDIYRDDGLFERALKLEKVLEDAVHSLKGAPFVADIRNAGFAAGIEIEADPKAPRPRRDQARFPRAKSGGARGRRHHRAVAAADRHRIRYFENHRRDSRRSFKAFLKDRVLRGRGYPPPFSCAIRMSARRHGFVASGALCLPPQMG